MVKAMQPFTRQCSSKPPLAVDEAVAADRRYFYEHPEEEYIREFVPGEFGKAELPEIPEAFASPPMSL
jgi:hypothetical protein